MSIIGIGIDAIEIDRVRVACTRTPALLARLYTEAERVHCTGRSGTVRYDRLAARFAAKEAVAKALGTGIRGFGWRDIEVANDELGKPAVQLHGGAAAHAAGIGVARAHLSLSRSTAVAFAHVVLEGAA